MATKSTALRNSQADNLVQNLDSLEFQDGSGTVIAESGTISWSAASGGSVNPTADITVTGVTAAGTGTVAATARLYDSGSSGDEIDGLTITSTGGGGDIELDNTNIADAQDVTLASGNVTITEPAATA